MGIIWKTVLFLLRRGPEIYETGRMLRNSMGGHAALPPADAEAAESGGGRRFEAVERELALLREDDRRLAEELERLSGEVARLGAETDRAKATTRILLALLCALAAAGLVLAATILARFP